jgi:putative oxidoreductase
MVLTVVGVAVATLGAGRWSVDHAVGIFNPPGWAGLTIACLAGGGGAAAILGLCWRPNPAKISADV